MLSFSRSIATIDLQPIVNPIASDWGFVYQCATLIQNNIKMVDAVLNNMSKNQMRN